MKKSKKGNTKRSEAALKAHQSRKQVSVKIAVTQPNGIVKTMTVFGIKKLKVGRKNIIL